jgi:hypothetical protein
MPVGLKAVVALNILLALVLAWAAVSLGGGFVAGYFPPDEQLTLVPIPPVPAPYVQASPAEQTPGPARTVPNDPVPPWQVKPDGRHSLSTLDAVPPPWIERGDGSIAWAR